MMKAKVGNQEVEGYIVSYGKFSNFYDGPLVWFVSEDQNEKLLHPSSLKGEVESEDQINQEHYTSDGV